MVGRRRAARIGSGPSLSEGAWPRRRARKGGRVEVYWRFLAVIFWDIAIGEEPVYLRGRGDPADREKGVSFLLEMLKVTAVEVQAGTCPKQFRMKGVIFLPCFVNYMSSVD